MPDQESFFNEITEGCFQGVGARSCLPHHIATRHSSMTTDIVEYLDGQRRELGKRLPLSLDFDRQMALLLLHCTHEEY